MGMLSRLAKAALRRGVPVLVELGKQALYRLPYPSVSVLLASQITDLGSIENINRICDSIDSAEEPADPGSPGSPAVAVAASDAGDDGPDAQARVIFQTSSVTPQYTTRQDTDPPSIELVFWALMEKSLDKLPCVCTYDGAEFGPEAGVKFSVEVEPGVSMRGIWHRERREHGEVVGHYNFEVRSPVMTSAQLIEWTKKTARGYRISRSHQPPGPTAFEFRFVRDRCASRWRPRITEMQWNMDDGHQMIYLQGWESVRDRVKDAAAKGRKLGVSLFGSPGTGKTSACRDIMNILASQGYHFFTVDLNTCPAAYLSSLVFKPITSEKSVYNIPNHKKAFILDEGDQYAALLDRSDSRAAAAAADTGADTGADTDSKQEEAPPTCQDLLTLLDGLFAHQSIWILISNHPEKFDRAVTRAGRLGDVVVDTGARFGARERRQMMTHCMKRPLDAEDEAFLESGPSGADVVKYVNDKSIRWADGRDAKRSRQFR
eukprot:jgi/Tetstr1/454196/TSEL_041115.t1